MLEKWKRVLDKYNIAGVVLTDLSKAFDSLDRDLLIAKLDAYGLVILHLNLYQVIYLREDRALKLIILLIIGLILYSGSPRGQYLYIREGIF